LKLTKHIKTLKSKNYFNFFLSVSVFFALIGLCFKLMHLGHTYFISIIGTILTLPFAIIGIIEVKNSKKIYTPEKIIWSIGFMFLSIITGILYLSFGKKRIN
jgi:hypothetical protein